VKFIDLDFGYLDFGFRALLKSFPELSARILGYVGKQAAMQLFEEHLQGQDIEYHNVRRSLGSKTPISKSGRRLVTYSIGRGLKWVAVSSFPLNLYEQGKMKRRGDAARAGILRRKFASGLSGRVQSYVDAAENFIEDYWFDGSGKKGTLRSIK